MTRAIVRAALAGLRQRHPIVLLHDGGGYRGATVQAIPEIIAKYRAAGYRFVRPRRPAVGECPPMRCNVQARRGVPRTCRNRSHCRCRSAR